MERDILQSKFNGEIPVLTFEDTLHQNTQTILAKGVSWDGHKKLDVISEKDVELLKKYDKANEEMRKHIIEKDGESYVELFLDLLMQLNLESTIQYLLALIDQLLSIEPNSVNLFLSLSAKKQAYPFDPFFRSLNRADWYMQAKASRILATLMSCPAANELPIDHIKTICQWCNEKLRKSEDQQIAIALTSLQRLLRKNQIRTIYASEDGLPLLAEIMKTKVKIVQLLYQAVYCMWQLSYNKTVGEMISKNEIIPGLVDLLKGVTKEKVIRLTLSTLVNLLGISNNNEQMIDYGIMKPLESLSGKNWGDEDIKQDLQLLQEALQKNIVILSSFDMYKKELLTGHLEWTPVHRSEKFWKENAHRFEEDNCKLLLDLKKLLTSSPDPLVVAIACFDAGEFVRSHPRGKVILQQLNIKIHLMKLMEDKEPEVKKQALLAVQKYFSFDYAAGSLQ